MALDKYREHFEKTIKVDHYLSKSVTLMRHMEVVMVPHMKVYKHRRRQSSS